MNIRTWQEIKALSNGQWPDDECMKEEIAQLRSALAAAAEREACEKPEVVHVIDGPDWPDADSGFAMLGGM